MTTLQDSGRFGWQRHGVAPSGAMDSFALASANAAAGNPIRAGAVEFMLLGGTFVLEGASARLAMAGAPCAVTLDSEPVAPATSFTIREGQRLVISPARAGVYAYLAVAGGFAVPPQLGSVSLHRRAHIGGLAGRPLQAGDRVPLTLPKAPEGPELALGPVPLDAEAPIRVVPGPQDDLFTDGGMQTFLSETYRISTEADRMGYRLSGPRIAHAAGYNIVSDGIVAGSVQVQGSGEPIVMMADRQTTGGYPKIATVITPDLRVVAQRRPGAAVRFAAIDMTDAQRLARERARFIAELPSRARPLDQG
jgi:biotin-dependent carboxylase-like uncharacterized protein